MEDSIVYTYLKEIELNALLVAAGVCRWYGPGSEAPDTLDDREDLHRIMAELYRKGVLDWDGDAAVISEPAGTVIRTIRDSKACILTGTHDGESGLTYVYISRDTTVQLMASSNDGELLKAAVMQFREWIDQLEETGFFPGTIGETPEMPDTEPRDICSVMELRDMNSGRLMQQLHAEDKGTYGILYLTEGIRQNAYLSTRSEYERIIRDWAEARA